MSWDLSLLRMHLEERRIEDFLSSLIENLESVQKTVEFAELTQCVLPPLLHEWFAQRNVSTTAVIHLWTLVRNDVILLVDNQLLSFIDEWLGPAWRKSHGIARSGPNCSDISEIYNASATDGMIRSIAGRSDSQDLKMRRIIIRNAFVAGPVHMCDVTNAKRSLCASSQEREFLKAIRMFFPTSLAHPNVPLRNFIQLERMTPQLSKRQLTYARRAEVDVLLCTHDEDPIAGFELDSPLHDFPKVEARDKIKNHIFALAGVPLHRIRADDTSNVRAEDFYSLLMAESETLALLRPKRLSPRRNHDFLVPSD